MALLNVRSLNNKTFIVNDTVTSHQLDCILLTETWLDETGSKELIEASPSNFSFSHRSRSNKNGGGVIAIVIVLMLLLFCQICYHVKTSHLVSILHWNI